MKEDIKRRRNDMNIRKSSEASELNSSVGFKSLESAHHSSKSSKTCLRNFKTIEQDITESSFYSKRLKNLPEVVKEGAFDSRTDSLE